MKKMEYIVYICNNDSVITFERFACKRLETVKRNMETLLASDLYMACIKGATKADFYRTPDGYQREKDPVYTMEI